MGGSVSTDEITITGTSRLKICYWSCFLNGHGDFKQVCTSCDITLMRLKNRTWPWQQEDSTRLICADLIFLPHDNFNLLDSSCPQITAKFSLRAQWWHKWNKKSTNVLDQEKPKLRPKSRERKDLITCTIQSLKSGNTQVSSMGEMRNGKCRSHGFEHLIHARHKSQEMVDSNDSCRTTGSILFLVLDAGATVA